MLVQKRYTFSSNHALNFEFGSFPGLALCRAYSLMVQAPAAATPRQLRDHEGPQPVDTLITILCFTFSTGCHALHEIFNTLS